VKGTEMQYEWLEVPLIEGKTYGELLGPYETQGWVCPLMKGNIAYLRREVVETKPMTRDATGAAIAREGQEHG